ncbi:MAG: type II toxin-antitoxin system RelE/ParE family toxin [Deferribacteraceae bacterium]|jgi:plasmid stabilization system protein ParE|nr:type II toxin-antitoxin system RelE/ParE family toxin [Deferribacteraceae bacterium]
MYKVYITETAQEDVLSSEKYILDILKSPQAARDLISEFEACTALLKRQPLVYNAVRNKKLAEKGYRTMRCKNFLIFYKIKGKTVRIIRFLHSKREWSFILH